MPNDGKFEATPEQAQGVLFDPESPPQKPVEKTSAPKPVIELTGAGLTLEQDIDFDHKDDQGFTPRMIRPRIGVEDPDFSSKKAPRPKSKRTDLTKDGKRVRINSLPKRSQLFAEVPDEENLR